MAARLPDGATLMLATTYGVTKTLDSLTNANPGVATLEASHGIATGELFEVTSGWSPLNERVVKAGTVSANDVPILGINTTDTARYPIGTGVGTVREITVFTQITQVLGFTTTGGDPSQVTYGFLEENFERSLSGPSSAQAITIIIADDDTLAGYLALQVASDDRTLRALKLTLPDGSLVLYNGKIHLNETPTVTKGAVMSVTATFNLNGKPVRY